LQRSGRDWRWSSQTRTSMFSAVATVFLDQNGNGVFDSGEQPLEGVRISGGTETATTDGNGQLVVTGLDSSTPARLRLIPTTIENPFWRPIVEAHRVLARPGQTIEVTFPVMVSNEIDGTVYLQTDEMRKPLASVEIQVLDSEGAVVHTTTTAYDGFYLIDELPGGTWSVQIAPKHLNSSSMTTQGTREVTFSSVEGDFTTMDWTLYCVEC
ncbi:MAG: SdrD B-like domain-containing protein, partial [Wenzhouxiangellaceae bacterium]